MSKISFTTEIKTLGSVRHRNLVRMAGHCIRNGIGLIVYEYMPRGTLFDLLHQKKPIMELDWNARHRIAVGIAQGLAYLHHDCIPQIIHMDLKSNNVLMDSELEPKIGDFGMAKLMISSSDSFASSKSSIVGTIGYIAPENGYSMRLTEKCDVYGYGVILLELLCRKMPVDSSFEDGLDIVSWSKKKLQENEDPFFVLDIEMFYWSKKEKLNAVKLLELALSCTQSLPDARPSMREIVGELMKLSSGIRRGSKRSRKDSLASP
ncbi:LRR receptor-like serine/threonine-protein kinase RCH1 [Amborella trichopoda]|uniref:non-specific serine/threonine protein kinase n=1 Tax=Amborella trichopoda TaxID=13333 RepID=W1PJT3_AMBTC|nr:LRR receptor-like serine/threonine-protein kinase RCH1 [Amborella trichopoda]ERN08263.1 hypothetical protein AMTR_s00018p00255520 [Amborella trichopoda]|eukprot:XP_006846587.3 LRR receptor-like serine/threonine-protein kinase RCH1 [Amborella trichopoda]